MHMHAQTLLLVISVTSCIQVKTTLHGGRVYIPRERLDMREMDFDLTAYPVPATSGESSNKQQGTSQTATAPLLWGGPGPRASVRGNADDNRRLLLAAHLWLSRSTPI